MNLREVSAYLEKEHGISIREGTLYKWISRKYLPAEKVKGKWNVTVEDVDEAIEEKNIPRPNGRRAMLSKEKRQQIRDMFDKKGWSQKGLARRFGVSESYISLIVRGLR